MNTIKSFQRISDHRIINRFADRSPFYNDITGLEMHFYALLNSREWMIRSIETPRGIFCIGEMIAGQGHNTINSILFSSIGQILVRMSNTSLINADDLRPYTAPVPVVAPTSEQAISGATIRQMETAYLRTLTRTIRLEDNEEFTTGARISRVRRESIAEFLVKFFKNWNSTRNTIYVDDSTVQTEMNKRRSLGDIFAICRYYYPTCTLKEVAKALYVTLPETITDGFRSSYCSMINKRVFYYDNEEGNGVFDKTTNDETGHPHRWWIEQLN